jgi:hypothetical protein
MSVRKWEFPYVFAYDICCDRRRRRVLKCLKQWRVDGQYSIHESLRNQLVQQAILLVLNPIAKTELGYIKYSADLVNSKVKELVADGYVWLGMTKISNSADLVNHELLLKQLYKLCGDKPLVALVRNCLLSQPQKFRIDGGGLFQGMILTPFLNELYLHQLDLCLKQKHIAFVRFGDELMVLARDEAGASKALDVVQRQLLKLGLVADHSQVVRSSFKYKFVGKRLPNSDGFWESLIGHKPEPEPVGMWQRLINTVGRWLSVYGLDLSLGFLHIPHNNRPSLSLDLLESVRPWVDEWLWKFVQSDGLLIPSQFSQTEENGCRLNHTGRSAFYAAWYDNAEVWLLKPIRDNIAMLLRNLRKYSDLVDSNNNYIS